MFRYESVNSTRKFTIVADIVSLLIKICKRDAPFRAVFKVKTLAVLFSAYPSEMKHIPRNLNLPPFWRCLFLWKWCNPFPPARARFKYAHSFDRCGVSDSVRIAIHFFVNFEVFKSLYLSTNLPDKHQTWGFCESRFALSDYVDSC